MDGSITQDGIIKECENYILNITKKQYTIVFTKQDAKMPIGANASLIGHKITIKNDWNDLYSQENSLTSTALHTLYYDIGHEIGHKDSQPYDIMALILIAFLVIPLIIIFLHSSSIIALSNPILIILIVLPVLAFICYALDFPMFTSRLMEIRADYCGIIFAQRCIYGDKKVSKKERDNLINEVFGYIIEQNKKYNKFDKGNHSHPSNEHRKAFLLQHKYFDKDSLMEFSHNYPFFGKLALLYRTSIFDGILLSMQDKK